MAGEVGGHDTVHGGLQHEFEDYLFPASGLQAGQSGSIFNATVHFFSITFISLK